MANYRVYLDGGIAKKGCEGVELRAVKGGFVREYHGTKLESEAGEFYMEIHETWKIPEALIPFFLRFTMRQAFANGPRREEGMYQLPDDPKVFGEISINPYSAGRTIGEFTCQTEQMEKLILLTELCRGVLEGSITVTRSLEKETLVSKKDFDDLRKERDELNERVEELYKLRDDLRNELADAYTKLTEKTRELTDKDDKIHELELDLRLMKERVRSLMMNIWRDMFKVRWWQGKNAVRRVVGSNIRAEPSLFNLMTPEVSSRIRDFMFKEE